MNYLLEQEQKNMLKDIDFYHFQENIKKQLLDIGQDAVKTASKKSP